MSIETLLQYGNWSGPGWTARKRDDSFDTAGVDRILSDDDRRIGGIDVYDNFVAKAHDMNEYAAQSVLREQLAELGVIDNTTTVVDGSPAFTTPLKMSEGGDERKRFASFAFYRDELAGKTPSDEDRGKLGLAFSYYYRHVALSNQQFAMDYTFNRPNLINMIADLSSLEFTLAFGPHLFLKEAAVVTSQAGNVEQESGIAPPAHPEWLAYLRNHFIRPTDPSFANDDGLSYVPVMTLEGLSKMSHTDVTQLFQALVRATDSNTRANRIYNRYRPEGASSLSDAYQVLTYPG
ncbi:MAG: hypothetical protein AAF409_09400 [Pseudomonadota bacterium]